MWSDNDKLRDAITKAAGQDAYHMRLVGSDIQLVTDAVNQGIDSYLEAIMGKFEPEDGNFIAEEDTAYWKTGDKVFHTRSLNCSVEPASLHVLVRRLMEDGSEEADLLASDICGTLDIELI